jgi:Tir chaperone protein (CesT) family
MGTMMLFLRIVVKESFMLEKLIHQLGRELFMEDLITATEDHHYLIPFDNDIEVEAIDLGKTYLLKGVIGAYPQQNTESFLLKTMEANLFGMGTRGAAIGLHEEGNLLTLSLEVDYNRSFKEFKEKLEDFISVIDFWRKEALKHE